MPRPLNKWFTTPKITFAKSCFEMNLFFFQNCISPHQIPFIEELSVFTDVDRVVVIAPRVDYDDRKLMGWKTSKLLETKGIEFLIINQ